MPKYNMNDPMTELMAELQEWGFSPEEAKAAAKEIILMDLQLEELMAV